MNNDNNNNEFATLQDKTHRNRCRVRFTHKPFCIRDAVTCIRYFLVRQPGHLSPCVPKCGDANAPHRSCRREDNARNPARVLHNSQFLHVYFEANSPTTHDTHNDAHSTERSFISFASMKIFRGKIPKNPIIRRHKGTSNTRVGKARNARGLSRQAKRVAKRRFDVTQNAKLLRSYSRPLVGPIHRVSRHQPCSGIRRLYHRSSGSGSSANLSGVTSLPEKFRRAIDFPGTFTDATVAASRIERER